MSRRRVLLATLGALLAPTAVLAWDVICQTSPQLGPIISCPDPFAIARTHWALHPRAEHRVLLERTMGLAGLPVSFQLPFTLTVFTNGQTVQAAGGTYPTVRPVRTAANAEATRELSIPAMASLPDFSYTLWDWATGNEICPVDTSNTLECHNYDTHIGWLNSNHMLPQARRFYEHLHRLALGRARECKRLFDQIPALQLQRFGDYVRSCETAALVIEAVAQHYLQDAWASGHMWERWGGPEVGDFGGDHALGFGIATLTGMIHGGKASLDDSAITGPFGPWDDPMNAPHPDDTYVDGTGAVVRPGIGDRFLAELLGNVNTGTDYDPQRRALFGCAVDSVRAVYGETAQMSGPMAAPATSEFDASRRASDGSCWDQRATNRAIGAGCGIHQGAYPNQLPIALDVTGTGFLLMLAQTTLAPTVANAPPLTGDRLEAYRADSAYACSEAKAMAADPTTADGTEMASGGLPAVLGVLPNSHFARGDASTPPAAWADPFLPWGFAAGDPATRLRTEALNLTFADAHASDRCRDLTEADLDAYRDTVAQTTDPAVRAVRCDQCVQMVTPHLRFGRPSGHDTRREALCAFVGPLNAAFAYTDEDPGAFTGTEPTDLPALRAAATTFCCTPTTTTTTLPPQVVVTVQSPGRSSPNILNMHRPPQGVPPPPVGFQLGCGEAEWRLDVPNLAQLLATGSVEAAGAPTPCGPLSFSGAFSSVTASINVGGTASRPVSSQLALHASAGISVSAPEGTRFRISIHDTVTPEGFRTRRIVNLRGGGSGTYCRGFRIPLFTDCGEEGDTLSREFVAGGPVELDIIAETDLNGVIAGSLNVDLVVTLTIDP